MKHLLSILAALCVLAAPAAAQTIRTLGYNTTNGQVVANTTNTLTFTNASVVFQRLNESDSIGINEGRKISYAGQNVINLEESRFLGFSVVDNTDSPTNSLQISPVAATTRANLGFSTNLNTLWTATNSSNARSGVGLNLAALTNTSNVTTMRALAGSTNTNQPFSGQFNVIDDSSITFTIVVSNGIIISATEY